MDYTLVIQKEAIIDTMEACEWYEEQKDGLGFELIAEIDTCYKMITDYPERYPFINHLYRRIKTNRFPYVVIYEVVNGNVIVNSVRHVKRRPRPR